MLSFVDIHVRPAPFGTEPEEEMIEWGGGEVSGRSGRRKQRRNCSMDVKQINK